MRFSHLADCHLGSWRQPELQSLNLEAFKKAIEISIEKQVDFVLIAGDLFDSAYPPIEILEEAFYQLKKLKDNKISCYYIAGSHDYSASGKTFLSVLEKAGFCKNIFSPEIKGEIIYLNPIVHGNVALYGYPGKKSGMEIAELRKVKLQESPGLFKLYALHTCIKGAVGSLPIDSLSEDEVAIADYYALGHLHIDYESGRFIYGGPTFPDNFQELEELKHGSFYIVETSPYKLEKISIKLKDIEVIDVEVVNALTGTDTIISEINKKNIENKIVLLRVSGKITQGKTSDIDFKKIEEYAKSLKCYSLLKSTSHLEMKESELAIQVEDMDKLETEIIQKVSADKKTKYDNFILPLINSLSLEKQEDETSSNFNVRLFSDIANLLELGDLK